MPVSFDATTSHQTVCSIDKEASDALQMADVGVKVPLSAAPTVQFLGADLSRNLGGGAWKSDASTDVDRSAKVAGHRAHQENTRKGLNRRGTVAALRGDPTASSAMRAKADVEDKFLKRKMRHCLKNGKHTIIVVLLILQLIGAIISLALLYPNKPKSGDWLDFGPRETMIVEDIYNAVFLAISRITAYMMYPCIILVFISKAHCLRTWLFTTLARLYMPYFERLHPVHECSGWFCFGLIWLHSIFHVIRWARLGHLQMLYNTRTGGTGIIGWVCVTVVVLPMGVFKLRRIIPYEIRKGAHTICGVGFGVVGALHAPATKVLIVYGTIVGIYILDWLYANVVKTYEVETCYFTRLQNSVVLHWKNPPGYNESQHGYVNICIPFIRRYEWHAISIYPHMEDEGWSSLCIAKAGDWSNQLHTDTVWKTTRPVWIQGPFLTPFSASVDYDNIIVVSSGSGISASLACLSSLKRTRRVSLIWLCRDASMVQHYMETYNFDTDAYTLIYYTGKQKLSVSRKLPPMVLIFETRPDLRSVICKIIKSIESEDGLPEDLLKQSEQNEERIVENSVKRAHLTTELDPIKLLKKLIGRALNHYTEAEVLRMIQGPEDNLSVSEFEVLISAIAPDAVFSTQTMEALALEFDDGTGNGTMSRGKFCDFCKQRLQDLHRDDPTTPMSGGLSPVAASEDLEAADFKTPDFGRGGSGELKEFIAHLDEEKADGKLKRWAVMYCGGSKIVTEALSTVCSDFDIKYDQERFDW